MTKNFLNLVVIYVTLLLLLSRLPHRKLVALLLAKSDQNTANKKAIKLHIDFIGDHNLTVRPIFLAYQTFQPFQVVNSQGEMGHSTL